MASKGPQRKLLSPSKATSGSENCNPNVIHGSGKRKISNRPKSSAAGQLLENRNTPEHHTSQGCPEFDLISPPRKHVCSSRRYASKNPDYAVPASVNPKELMVSKRHNSPRKGATMCKCCIRNSKEEGSAADDQIGGTDVCSSCSDESQKRRWSFDHSACKNLAYNGEPMASSLISSERHEKEALHYLDSGQISQASIKEAEAVRRLPDSETAHQERSTDTTKSWSLQNDSEHLKANPVDTEGHYLISASGVSEDSTPPAAFSRSAGSEVKHREAYFNRRELQTSPSPAGEGRYCFGAGSTPQQSSVAEADDENCSLMQPEDEEEEVTPSPEKSGNWRLNAVLESFGSLSPTREGRVKTLVRAFESLLSFTERKVDEQQAPKPGGYSLKFSYLRSTADVEGVEKNTQREDSTYGGEGESENEENFTYDEARVTQWQTDIFKGDVKDEEISGLCKEPPAVPLPVQSLQRVKQCVKLREEAVNHGEKDGRGKRWQLSVVVKDKKHGIGKQWQEHEVERESSLSLQESNEKAQEINSQPVVGNVEKDGMCKQSEPLVAEDDEKHGMARQWKESFVRNIDKHGVGGWQQERTAKRESAQSVQVEVGERGEMTKLSQKQQEKAKGRKPNEHQADRSYTQTLDKGKHEKGYKTNKREQQSLVNVSVQELLFEGEVRHVPAFLLNPTEAAFERHLPNQKISTNAQHHSCQKSKDGHFASIVARKKQRDRIRDSRRGSNCSIASARPPLVQKSQMQSVPDKPRVSMPQPFKLLTEERGHMKEQEFMMRLRQLLEEEEKLRIPLAQGLPWTTDEPEVPYKPPIKENTKPLDIHLNSEIRAIERADFDRFIAEKLLYIEQRRLEEECRRRAAEEEEIKQLRQEMVPKAQLMPYFDRPFRPRRSSKRPTIPKEPQFLLKKQPKRQKCVANST